MNSRDVALSISDASHSEAEKLRIQNKMKEMSQWSCERVGQYLEEIQLGQYKQVSLSFQFLFNISQSSSSQRF